MLDVPTSVLDGETTITPVLNDVDYWKIERTVDKLGINPTWTTDQLNYYLMEGE